MTRPAKSSDSTASVAVSDFGARPGAGSDAVPAIRAALAAARRRNGAPAIVRFGPGRYRCLGGAGGWARSNGSFVDLITPVEALDVRLVAAWPYWQISPFQIANDRAVAGY